MTRFSSLATARCCVWYAIAWEKSPIDWCAFPRFAYALPSPARLPTSLEISRSCVWYSIACEKSPSRQCAFPTALLSLFALRAQLPLLLSVRFYLFPSLPVSRSIPSPLSPSLSPVSLSLAIRSPEAKCAPRIIKHGTTVSDSILGYIWCKQHHPLSG